MFQALQLDVFVELDVADKLHTFVYLANLETNFERQMICKFGIVND